MIGIVIVSHPFVDDENLWSPYAKIPIPESVGSNVPLILYDIPMTLICETVLSCSSRLQMHTKIRAGSLSEVVSPSGFFPTLVILSTFAFTLTRKAVGRAVQL